MSSGEAELVDISGHSSTAIRAASSSLPTGRGWTYTVYRRYSFVQPADSKRHIFAQIGIEIGQRLVEQKRTPARHQRARQRHPLLWRRIIRRIALARKFAFGCARWPRAFWNRSRSIYAIASVDDIFATVIDGPSA